MEQIQYKYTYWRDKSKSVLIGSIFSYNISFYKLIIYILLRLIILLVYSYYF